MIDRQEQQSDYYDRSMHLLLFAPVCAIHLICISPSNSLHAFRTKAVFFVMIVCFWDHELDPVSCVSHSCVTPNLKKGMNKSLILQSTYSTYTPTKALMLFIGESSTCFFGLTIVETNSSATTSLVGALVSSSKRPFGNVF